MKPCTYISEAIVLVTPAAGEPFKAKLVTEYGRDSGGGLIVVATRFVDVNNVVITLNATDMVEHLSAGQPVAAQDQCVITTEQDVCGNDQAMRMVTEYGFDANKALIVVSTRYVNASNEVVDASGFALAYGQCPVEQVSMSAPGALLSANICVGSPILVPSGNREDVRTVGTDGTYADFVTAMADATVVDGTILRAISDVTDTATVNVNRAVVIDLDGFTHSNATSVTQFNVTAPLAVIKGGTVHHAKVANTSIETAITVNTVTGVAFVVDNTIKVQEFGVIVQSGAMISGNKFEYAGASQTNSHRFIALFKITATTKIDNNEFTCSTIPATTRYSNFVFMGAIAGSTWTAPLYITRNIQTGGSLRQFVFNEALVPAAGSELIVAANSFNDFNGGIGLLTPALYNGLDKIVIVDNDQGADATGNFKGVFFVDGTGTLDNDTVFIYGGNTTAAGALRPDYLSLASDTDNIVAHRNTVTPPTAPAVERNIQDALEDTGLLLQDLKGRRTYIVDKDGVPLDGFGTEADPYVVKTGPAFPEGVVCYSIDGSFVSAQTINGVTIWRDENDQDIEAPDLANAELTCCTSCTPQLTFGDVSPTANGQVDGEEFFVTTDGTHEGEVLEQWIWDHQSATWVQRPSPEFRTTSIEPVVFDTAWVGAQADDVGNLAKAVELSSGTILSSGLVTWPAHGLTIGETYYTSQTVAGEFVTPAPTTGLSQALFTVIDANTIDLQVQEGVEFVDELDTAPAEFARVVYVDTTDPSTATIFDLVTPPATNDDTLKEDSANLYAGTDGGTWIWNGSAYVTKPIPASTAWNLQGTSSDAGSDKTTRIWRKGPIMVGDGVDSTTTFNGYFLARGNFSTNPSIFAFQNTLVPGTGFQFNNGAGPGQFMPGMSFTPSNGLRTIMAVNALEDAGFQEPGMQIRVGKGTGGLTSLTSRPTFEIQNGTRVDMRMTALGNLLIGTSSHPGQEKLVVTGAAKLAPNAAYSTAVDGATTPVPNGGAGTVVFAGGRPLCWNGTVWKALDASGGTANHAGLEAAATSFFVNNNTTSYASATVLNPTIAGTDFRTSQGFLRTSTGFTALNSGFYEIEFSGSCQDGGNFNTPLRTFIGVSNAQVAYRSGHIIGGSQGYFTIKTVANVSANQPIDFRVATAGGESIAIPDFSIIIKQIA